MSTYYSVILKYENGTIIVDGEKACRACLSTECKLIDLFSNNLAEELSELTGTAVQLDDGLPQHLCTYCCALLRKGTAFRKKCRSVVSMFQSFGANEVLVNNIISKKELKCDINISHLQVSLHTSKALKMDIPSQNLVDCNDDSSSLDVKNVLPAMDHCEELNILNNEAEVPTVKDDVDKADPLLEQLCDIKYDIEIDVDNDAEDNPTGILEQLSNDSDGSVDANDNQPQIDEASITIDNLDPSADQIMVDMKKNRIPKHPRGYTGLNVSGEVDSLSMENLKTLQVAECKKDSARKAVTEKSVIEISEDTESDASEDGSDGDCSDDEFLKLISNILSRETVEPSGTSDKKKIITKKQKAGHSKNLIWEEKYNFKMHYCTKEEEIRNIKARQESQKYKSSEYKCQYCFKGFQIESFYKRHMTRHDPSSGKHKCEFCHTHFDNIKNHTKHMWIHKRRLKCQYTNCEFVCRGTADAEEHFNRHNGAKIECKECGIVFKWRSGYTLHLRKKHGSHTCSICNEPFNGDRGLRVHMLKAHKEAMEYRCSTCGVQFLSSDAHRKHVDTTPSAGCTDVRPCEHCGVNLATEDLLLQHLQTEHEMKLRCDMCGLMFKNETLRKKHCYNDHGTGRGRSRGSTDKGPRQQRRPGDTGDTGKRKKVTKDLRLMCETCGRYLQSYAALKTHQRMHTGEKPFQCTVCSKRFRLKDLLRFHMYSHTGETPFKCPQCPKAFTVPSNRDRHILVHTKEKRHPCPLCGRMFQQKNFIKTHIRTFHLKEPWPKRNRRHRDVNS